MRIQGKHKNRYIPWLLGGIILVAIASLYLLVGLVNPEVNATERHFFCDAETTDGKIFMGDGGNFENIICRTEQTSFSGQFSCGCSNNNKYGFSKLLDGLTAGDTVIYSVWLKEDNANGRLVFSSEANNIYQASTTWIDKIGEWRQLEDTLIIPPGYKPNRTIIYPMYTGGTGTVYFDDIDIRILPKRANEGIVAYKGAHLEMQLTDENYRTILRKKDEAFKKGLLFASRADLVNADIKVENDNYNALVRLKGDLLDHLSNGKFSFRIELKGNREWRDMNIFSIHNSRARSHLAEWYMHELFKAEDIITPQYDFINFSLNGKNLGVYAYEQHFDNSLLAYNKRPIGPIIRHTDDGYWKNVNDKIEPFYWTKSSQVELFNKENAGDAEFLKLYDTAHSMLNDFIHGRKQLAEVFDVDKLSKYYALLEISHATHAQLFTNIRFYLNPYEGILEPIGYDCFGDQLPNVNKTWTAMGEGFNRNWESSNFLPDGNDYMGLFFADDAFFASYIKYLLHYSSEDYLNKAKATLQGEAEARYAFIRSDEAYQDYNESWEQVFLKSAFNRKKIYPKANYSLTAYIRDGDRSKIQLHGFHYFPLEVVAYKSKGKMIQLDSVVLLEAYNPGVENDFVNLDLAAPADQIVFRTLGTDSLFYEEVPKINATIDDVPIVNVDLSAIEKLDYLHISGQRIDIREGRHTIDMPLVLPKGYKINLSPGTVIEFKGDGCILSYSPVSAIGSAANPIQFIGESGINSAIYIAEGEGESHFKHCLFNNLGQFNYRNIKTDGALSVYKSRLIMEDCSFDDISAKDALNVAMSQCSLYHIDFNRCKGDMLDAYYASIFIDGLKATQIGKDGIELEGGSLNGQNIDFTGILRSGIRATEKAKVNLRNYGIADSHLALFASSHSDVYISGVDIRNVERGIELLSVAEPHSRMTLTGFKAHNLQQEYVIQQNGELYINGYKKKAY